MRVALGSDLHLEFGDLELKNEGAEVLILSGDILVASQVKDHDPHGIMEGTRSDRFHKFFENVCSEFAYVVYVVGNHEHYNGDFALTVKYLKEKFKRFKNLKILDKETFVHQDVVFVGSTLWTDMNKEDPLTLFHIKSTMNDFKCIDNSARKVYRKVPIYKKAPDGSYVKDEKGNYIQESTKMKEECARFSPEDSVEEHRKSLAYISEVYATMPPWEKMVVVSHHTPSFQSCHVSYTGDTLMNGAYHSNLEEFILDRPGIKLWTHGHTHEDFDYMIGDARVVCNPRGYIKYEERAFTFKLKYMEI